MNTCPDCNRLTSGNCGKHSYQPISQGYWQFVQYPRCVRCNQTAAITIVLPYGSRYDGEHLCAACIRECVDPEIHRRHPELIPDFKIIG